MVRVLALRQLGNGLHAADHHEDAMSVQEAEISLLRRVGAPEDNILAIGSGGGYARAAASALAKNTKMAPNEIVAQALKIAADICVYTNDIHTIETIVS